MQFRCRVAAHPDIEDRSGAWPAGEQNRSNQESGHAGCGARSRPRTEDRREIGRVDSGEQTFGGLGPCIGSHAQQRRPCANDSFVALICPAGGLDPSSGVGVEKGGQRTPHWKNPRPVVQHASLGRSDTHGRRADAGHMCTRRQLFTGAPRRVG